MKIEITERSEAFCRETVNVLAQYKSLVKEPEKGLRDHFKDYRMYAVISAVCLVVLAVLVSRGGSSGIMKLALALLVIDLAGCLYLLSNLQKLQKSLRDDRRPSVLTLDERGAEICREGNQPVRLDWPDVAFIRLFSEALCFIPKSTKGSVISVSRVYSKEVLDYLDAESIDVTVIK